MRQISFLFLLFLNSCNLYNSYLPPCASSPDSWKGETAEKAEPLPCQWWEIFENEKLNELEKEALAHNREIEKAWYNFREGVAKSREARAKLFPQINLDPNYTRLDRLDSFSGLPNEPSAVRLDQTEYSFPFDAQYEVDLWNKLGLASRAAALNAEARCWALRALQVTITAQVAENYFAIRTLDAELDVLRRNVTARSKQLEVTRARYEAGLVNYTDVSRAETEYFNVKADLEDILRTRILFINGLAVLVGKPASSFDLNETSLPEVVPTVFSYIPADVLQKRPDIHEAERQIAAAHAEIGVAWASFFPSFTLEGTLGYASPIYTNLFSWQTRLWGYAYKVAQFVFDGGGRMGRYQATKEIYLQKVASYQQAILKAFQEVEDALANIEYRRKQEENLTFSVLSSQDTLELNNLLYNQGLVNYLDVVDAERTNLEAKRLEVRTKGAQFIATVALVKALGGSW